jgi:hypothetical protein
MRLTRREVLIAGGAGVSLFAPDVRGTAEGPWYRRTYRWGQTNITEKDPIRYDIAWWREFWKLTQVQGVIINGKGWATFAIDRLLDHEVVVFGD